MRTLTGGTSGTGGSRRGAAVALAISLAQAALLALQLGLDQLLRPDGGVLANDLLGAFIVLAFPAVGLLVLRRYPAHVVGWLFVLTNLPWAVNAATGAWARYGLATGLPGVPLAVWLYPWQGDVGFGLTIGLLYVFPTGSLPSSAWRPAVWLLIAVTALGTVAAAFAPGAVDSTIGVSTGNPLGIGGEVGYVLRALVSWQFVLFMVPLALGVAAIVVRFRRSRGLERQQLNWFASAASVFGALLVVGVLTSPLGDSTNAFWVVALLVLPLLPVSAGVAILRYRLYEIDLVINRTLVYGSLTAVLGLVYAGSVLLLQATLSPIAGRGSLAVAASTLLVAALFQPVRRRLQDLVDRRLYRARYDATREIAGFAGRLRDEVDVPRLSAAIAGTLDRTVHPAFATVWPREGGER